MVGNHVALLLQHGRGALPPCVAPPVNQCGQKCQNRRSYREVLRTACTLGECHRSNEDMHECTSEGRNVYAGCLPIRGRFLQQGSAPRWPPYSKGRAASAGPTQSPCQLISPSTGTVMSLVSPRAAKLPSKTANPFLLVRIHVSLTLNMLTRPGRAFQLSHAALLSANISLRHGYLLLEPCLDYTHESACCWSCHAHTMCMLLQLSISQMASIRFLQLEPVP